MLSSPPFHFRRQVARSDFPADTKIRPFSAAVTRAYTLDLRSPLLDEFIRLCLDRQL